MKQGHTARGWPRLSENESRRDALVTLISSIPGISNINQNTLKPPCGRGLEVGSE